jgi:predicted AAA+ superfamily ATPase
LSSINKLMNKMSEKIIQSHKEEFEQKRSDFFVKREVQIKGPDSGLIQVITGPRRAGKSFFAIHSMDTTQAVGYVNFDDERLTEITDFDAVMDAVKRVYSNPKTLLFDEIQNVPKWELIVNRLQRKGYLVFITGSNSRLLSQELSTHLTGRHLEIKVFPFSFRELQHLSEKENPQADVRIKCLEYLKRGGFPELWIKHIDFPEYLRSLFDSILFRDIVKRYKIRDSASIYKLALYLVSNITTEFSYQSLAKRLSSGSVMTIRKYISFLEEAYLLFTVHRFSYKVREQISSNKKIYTYDNGFFQTIAHKFSPDSGKLFENAVAIELKRHETEGGVKLFYWKNEKHEEVDFVVQRELSVESLIQVCYDLSDPKVKNREIRALLKAGEDLNCKKLIIITDDYENIEKTEWFGLTGNVEFIPIHKYLLK